MINNIGGTAKKESHGPRWKRRSFFPLTQSFDSTKLRSYNKTGKTHKSGKIRLRIISAEINECEFRLRKNERMGLSGSR